MEVNGPDQTDFIWVWRQMWDPFTIDVIYLVASFRAVMNSCRTIEFRLNNESKS